MFHTCFIHNVIHRRSVAKLLKTHYLVGRRWGKPICRVLVGAGEVFLGERMALIGDRAIDRAAEMKRPRKSGA